jgi:hypothetical protein
LDRGGINKTVTGYFKQLVDECASGAYLFTAGDMYTYYLLYMQLAGRYRQDVICVDLNLLNTRWYPQWLAAKGIGFGYDNDGLTKLKATHWAAKQVTIPNKTGGGDTTGLVWQLKPDEDNMLTRPAQLVLDMLQQNAFVRPVYFADDVPQRGKLYLGSYLQNKGLTDRLVPAIIPPNEGALAERLKTLPLLPAGGAWAHNRDNIQLLNNYRFAYATAAIAANQQGHGSEALAILRACERKYPETTLPFFADAAKQWFMQLKAKAETGR